MVALASHFFFPCILGVVNRPEGIISCYFLSQHACSLGTPHTRNKDKWKQCVCLCSCANRHFPLKAKVTTLSAQCQFVPMNTSPANQEVKKQFFSLNVGIAAQAAVNSRRLHLMAPTTHASLPQRFPFSLREINYLARYTGVVSVLYIKNTHFPQLCQCVLALWELEDVVFFCTL